MKNKISMENRQFMKNKIGAYFTLEAALIFPIALSVILLVVYLLFYEYDRCLMEQDMGALSLYGATVQAEDNEARMRLLAARKNALYEEKYIAWKNGEISMRLEKGKVQVERTGELLFPFLGLSFWSSDSSWGTTVRYESVVMSPATIIRNWRKVTGGK